MSMRTADLRTSLHELATVTSLRRPLRDTAGVSSPVTRDRTVRAVLFDVDGTLYRQPPLRICMGLELVVTPFVRPRTWRRMFAALSHYRRAQEQLRHSDMPHAAEAQVAMAAQAAGVTTQQVTEIVDEWMQRRPLKYLRVLRAAGVEKLLDALAAAGVACGTFSDYPAHDKLVALGLADRFDLELCSTDQEVRAFKPHPRGYLRACEYWGLEPHEVLVIGDRADVDAAGAAAAGMDAVIIGRQRRPGPEACLFVPSMERLHRVFEFAR